jgi:hypothetical protein
MADTYLELLRVAGKRSFPLELVMYSAPWYTPNKA